MRGQNILELSVKEVEDVAHVLAQELMEYGEPIPPFNTRFPDKLESCLKTPFQKFNNKSLYRGLVGKGAALFYLMIKNHPFQNGNKRVAVMTLLYFFYKNGWWLAVDNDEFYLFANSVAAGRAGSFQAEMSRIRSFIRKSIKKFHRKP